MMAAVICKRYGWTYQQYMEQPAPFLATIQLMFRAEEEAKQKQIREAQHHNG